MEAGRCWGQVAQKPCMLELIGKGRINQLLKSFESFVIPLVLQIYMSGGVCLTSGDPPPCLLTFIIIKKKLITHTTHQPHNKTHTN